MIAVAAISGLIIFVFTLLILRLMGPNGPFHKRRSIEDRIFNSPEAQAKKEKIFEALENQNVTKSFKSIDDVLLRNHFAQQTMIQLKRLGYSISISLFLLACLMASFFIFILISQSYKSNALGVLFALATLVVPFIYLQFKNERYTQKFTELFPNALSIMSNSIKVGQSIETGIRAVCKSNLAPVSKEFNHILTGIKLGQPLHIALRRLHKSVPIEEVKIFVVAVSIHQELGGNLSEILATLEYTIRERFALNREIKVLSAQGIMSAWVLFAIPIATAAIWFFTDSQMVIGWLGTTFGKIGLIYCIMASLMAAFVIKKVINIKD